MGAPISRSIVTAMTNNIFLRHDLDSGALLNKHNSKWKENVIYASRLLIMITANTAECALIAAAKNTVATPTMNLYACLSLLRIQTPTTIKNATILPSTPTLHDYYI